MKTQADRHIVAAKIAEIESEMMRVGLWQPEPLGEEQYNFHQAFALDTMTFTQWLQFIFIPRVNDHLRRVEGLRTDARITARSFTDCVARIAYQL